MARNRKQNENRKPKENRKQRNKRNQTWNNFFLLTFSDPEAARDLAENIIPEQYQHVLQNSQVTIEQGTWIDQELRESRTDLLLKCTRQNRNRITITGSSSVEATPVEAAPGKAAPGKAPKAAEPEEFYIYILFDHKSNPDRWTAWQLLSYMIRIWTDLRKSGKPSEREPYLPEIIPVIFYHGMKKWPCPKSFQDLVRSAHPEKEHQVKYTPVFFNLQEKQDKELQGGIRAMVGLLFLKYLVHRIDRNSARILLETLHQHPARPELKEYFRSCYKAIFEKKDKDEIALFLTVAKENHYTDVEEENMTYAQELRTEGRREGKREGKLEAKQEDLIRLLTRKFGLEESDKQKIQGTQSLDTLNKAIDKLLFAETREEVLEKLTS